MRTALVLALLVLAPQLSAASQKARDKQPNDPKYGADVVHLLDRFEAEAGELLKLKGIAWAAVRREFTQAAKDVASDQEHVELCARLVARLQDGHAGFTRVDVDMQGRAPDETYGCGLELVEVGSKLFVKRAFGSAAASGVDAGSEVVKIDGQKADKWFESAVAKLRDTKGFSTTHAARWAACTWGLTGPAGERLELELKKPKGGAKKATLMFARTAARVASSGPLSSPRASRRSGARSHGRSYPAGTVMCGSGVCPRT